MAAIYSPVKKFNLDTVDGSDIFADNTFINPMTPISNKSESASSSIDFFPENSFHQDLPKKKRLIILTLLNHVIQLEVKSRAQSMI
jgi:hypothetical protein